MLKATFRQLQTFVAVVESGSFTGAAVQLNVSPAAISDQIRALEHRISCILFDRRPGSTPVLNTQGELFLQHATQLLRDAAEIPAIGAGSSPSIQTVRLAADEFIIDRRLRPTLPSFQRSCPDIQIVFLHLNVVTDIVHALRSGRADLAYVNLWSLEVDWPIEIISRVEVGLFVSPRHALARSWPPSRGQKLPLIAPIAGSPMDLVMIRSLRHAGITRIESVAHTQYGATMSELAKDGVGVCYSMRDSVLKELEAGDLVELKSDLPAIHRCALRRPGAREVKHLKQVDDYATALIRA